MYIIFKLLFFILIKNAPIINKINIFFISKIDKCNNIVGLRKYLLRNILQYFLYFVMNCLFV